MYVITGATGNTGKPIVKALLEAGKQVRIISRDAKKSKELTDLGAELFQGSSSDSELLKRAFAGATALYAMVPADYTADDYTLAQMRHVEAFAEALETVRVNHVVTLSSQGADKDSGTGVVYGLHLMEERLNKIEGINILHLRPGYFMENTLGMIGLMKENGILGSPLKPNTQIAAIATLDIAMYASKRLLALDFNGKSHQDLLGQREVTYAELAKVYGSAVGKPQAEYVEFSPESFKQSFLQTGASASSADNMNEFIDALNRGLVDFPARTKENTTATSIEDFSQTFKYLYERS